jgi:hypothetical protein
MYEEQEKYGKIIINLWSSMGNQKILRYEKLLAMGSMGVVIKVKMIKIQAMIRIEWQMSWSIENI